MPKTNRFVTVLFIACALAFAGCATSLAPSGAYTDKTLYDADLVISTSYDVLHAFVTFEYTNRATLEAANPATAATIKAAADNVRLHSREWLNSAIALEAAYKANPTTDNATKLTAAIAILQAALSEATKYLVQTTPAPATP
jgi:hypothetical protein